MAVWHRFDIPVMKVRMISKRGLRKKSLGVEVLQMLIHPVELGDGSNDFFFRKTPIGSLVRRVSQ
jgi:hypothetical protein